MPRINCEEVFQKETQDLARKLVDLSQKDLAPSKLPCIFNADFVRFCLEHEGVEVPENTPCAHICGLAVYKNLMRIFEKLDQLGVGKKELEYSKEVIDTEDVVRAMGLCGLQFVSPDQVKSILNK